MMQSKIQASRLLVYRTLILLCFLQFNCHANGGVKKNSPEQLLPTVVNIGVIRNRRSPFSTMIDSCIEMAVSDFYSDNRTHMTRLELIHKDVNDVLDVDLAVLELLEQEQVHAVLEPQGSTDEVFVAELGSKLAKVPIISFAARGSTLLEAENPYFIRAAVDDVVQARALADICRGFKWKEVVTLYEDTEYGYRFLSHLSKAFRDVEIELSHLVAIPPSSDESHLINELESLKVNQTVEVFLVHVNASLGSRLFPLAKKAGMMSKGHAWIITDSLSIFLNSMDHETHDSMDGVLGIRPYMPLSKDLLNFSERWKKNYSMSDLNVYGLRAYDMVTALANAVEKIGPGDDPRSSSYERNTKNGYIRTSSIGPLLLRKLYSSTRFSGLSGDFEVVDGKLRPSVIEIFNVVGTGEKTVGFWTLDRGLQRESSSTSRKGLRRVMWPGDSVDLPKGYWSVSPSGSLRVGVPCSSGSAEFVNVAEIYDNQTNEANATGFAIEVFQEALKVLPFHIDHKFYCFGDRNNASWSYDDMLRGMPEKFDMVVADTTIWAPRAVFADFSLPYLASGIVLIVRRKPLDMWMFTKPLRWDLWLAILVSCIFMGLVIWILERRRGSNIAAASEEESNERIGMTYLTPVAVLAFQERNMVVNKCSIFVLVCWMFMAFILMQSFTANLSAILTIDQLKFSFSEGYHVGYRNGSFTKKFLMENLNIDESRLKGYITDSDFNAAMSEGSKKGGIDAIFDEIPLMWRFMNQYKSTYAIVGPTYSTAGLGFAFPVGSPLAAEFSRAIVNVTERRSMEYYDKWGSGSSHFSMPMLEGHSTSLTFHEFSGLFYLLASALVFAVICSETTFLSKLNCIRRQLMSKCFRSNYNEVANSDELHNGEQEPRNDSIDHEDVVEEAQSNEADAPHQCRG